MMTDAQLQAWICEISERDFGLPFRHQASFNRRLTATGGRYFPKTHNIDISWKQLIEHGPAEVEKIIKHELCHYHLHLQKRGYKHRDPEFKELLRQVGGTRFCKPVSRPGGGKQTYKYMLRCTGCGLEYRRKRKVDVRRYVCGKCRGKLQLFQLDLTKEI